MSTLPRRASSSNARLHGIDILRFIAALSVLLYHLVFLAWQVRDQDISFPALHPFTWWGRMGVEIFFVVSGFVIAYSSQGVTASTFFRSRFLRLVPAALVCAIFTFAVRSMDDPTRVPEFGEMLINTVLFHPLGGWLDSVYWTLGIEICFYAAIWLLLACRRERYVEAFALLIGAASAASWFVWLALGYPPCFVSGPTSRIMDLLLLHHGIYFAIGVMLWMLFYVQANPARILAVCIGSAVGFIPIVHTTGFYQSSPTAHGMLSILIAWFGSIAWMAISIRYSGSICRTLRPKTRTWIMRFGLATYPLYLLHNEIGVILIKNLVARGISQGVALAATVISMIAASLAVAAYVEPLVRRVMSSLLDRFGVKAPSRHEV